MFNLKGFSYPCGQCLTESKDFFSPQPRKAPNVVQQLMSNITQKENQFEDYFKFIKVLGIDTEENYNEIKEYYLKGLLRFNIP